MKDRTAPLISIALCTFNGEKYLRKQLDSLVSQTYPNLEIVAVDDQSTDQTWEILQEYHHRYPKFTCLRNSSNLGLQRNFEKALKHCHGEWIAISDQDDIWDKDKIQKLYDISHGNILVYHDSEFIKENEESMDIFMSEKLNFVRGKNPKPFLLFNCVSGHSMLFHHSLLEKALPFPEVGFYDHWLAFVASHWGNIDFIQEPLVKYRQHSNNVTDVLGKSKQLKGLSRSLKRITRENEWLKTCAAYQDRYGRPTYAKALYGKAKLRLNNYFNLNFGWEIWINRGSLLTIKRVSNLEKFWYAVRNIWGLKTKALFKS
jgi:glycosyltransferase involved in cell wall biosynthesis